jgi:flagellar biosynthetic protein FliR
MLERLLADQAWALFLVFARLGAAFAVLPGFAEAFVPPRMRLLLAGAATAALAPVVAAALPPLPAEPGALALVVAGEAAAGLFLGLVARLMLAAAHVAGMIVGFQTSLASAFAFDPTSQQQAVITSAWMSTLAIVLLLAADLHHVMLRALADSYALFPPGTWPDPGEFAEAATDLVARSFALGVRMAAPFLIYGVVLFAALGLLQRLMPQVQIFFLAVPLQLMVGFVLLAGTIAAAMTVFLADVETGFAAFVRPR